MVKNINTLIRKQRLLKIRDVWYQADKLYTDADVVYYMQMDKPLGDEHYAQYTIVSDLTASKEIIFGRISPSSRNLINQIAKDSSYKYTMRFEDLDMHTIQKFVTEYNKFARLKNLALSDMARLKAYFENGLLGISYITNSNNEIVTWHVYRISHGRVMLIDSLSIWYMHTKNKIKRKMSAANRYCHYKDMIFFKEQGIAVYDWGGWYTGNTNKALLGVNSFKEKFGGTVIPNYNSIAYISFKGKLFRSIKKLMGKI